jgi:hypothetical protein
MTCPGMIDAKCETSRSTPAETPKDAASKRIPTNGRPTMKQPSKKQVLGSGRYTGARRPVGDMAA